ncbi:MAG TPA: hypothetical protein VGL38_06185 [bacterium]
MKRFGILVLLCLSVVSSGLAQRRPGTLWSHTLTAEYTQFSDVARAADGGFVFAGYIGGDFPTNTDRYLYKTDASGTLVWEQDSNDPANVASATGITPTSDGGFILSCSDPFEGWKVDEDGVQEWFTEYHSSDPGMAAGGSAWDVAVADDGYLFVGQTHNTGNTNFPYIVKTGFNGTKLWDRHLGIALGSTIARAIKPTSDGAFIITGDTHNGTTGVFLCKMQADSHIVWTTSLISPDTTREVADVVQTPDGGYVVTGSAYIGTQSMRFFVVRFNASGARVWERWNGDSDHWSYGSTVLYSQLGNIVVGGFSTDDIGESRQSVILCYDLSGNLQWTFAPLPSSQENTLSSMVETADNQLILACTASGYPWYGLTVSVLNGLDTPHVVITRFGQNNYVTVSWDQPAYVDHWDIGISPMGESDPWAYPTGGLNTPEFVDDNLPSNPRMYYVVKAYCSYTDPPATSAWSDTVGYVALTCTGGAQTVTTCFGLPFDFWQTVNGVPQWGTVSYAPSDIIRDQSACGTPSTADRISAQSGGAGGWRNSASSCSWTGPLETDPGMRPGYAYYYANRSGADRVIVLAGKVNNSGYYATRNILAPPEQGGETWIPVSWRDSQDRAINLLNLATDGFTGATAFLQSDRVVAQSGGNIAWRYLPCTPSRNTAECGWAGSLEHITPGAAYWITNKHVGHTWTYTYRGN